MISDGRGLAMALNLGAQAAWVGTRFVTTAEAGTWPMHKRKMVQAAFGESKFLSRAARLTYEDLKYLFG